LRSALRTAIFGLAGNFRALGLQRFLKPPRRNLAAGDSRCDFVQDASSHDFSLLRGQPARLCLLVDGRCICSRELGVTLDRLLRRQAQESLRAISCL
jgi:hypothetical protein